MEKIIFYTTNCPKCKILKQKLETASIKYEICEDTEKMIGIGIKSVPVLEINNTLLNFVDAVQWIKEVTDDNTN